MSKKISLNRTQLKIIAIISMVIDHSAWGFLDFYTPLAQFLHVCGRMTIPIMCFFIAEGFKKTGNLKKYILRMAAFAAITIFPFYIFFHEEYDYRQNIIFDLLLGLLMLTALESRMLKKWQKVVCVALLFAVSITIGGWMITPQCFILAFYYGRTFKEKAKWFVLADLATVAFLVVAISLNSIYHFSKYDWVWWDKFYLLGFILALPLIYCYNGERGKDIIGKYFFYAFYPLHFLVLAGIKALTVYHASAYAIYLAVHIISLLLILFLMMLTLGARPSKGQTAILFFEMSAALYILGFVLEILAESADGYYIACVTQYFGELVTFIALLYFVAQLCRVTIPHVVYILHVMVSLALIYQLMMTRETGFFYSYIGVNGNGVIRRPELEHSTGFFLAVAYMFLVCVEVVVMCINIYKRGNALDRKRVRLIFWAMLCCWAPYGLTLLGVTGGYEVPAIGILAAAVFLYMSFFKYGILDSVVLASENALDHAHEGVVVVDNKNRVIFKNRLVYDIIGTLEINSDIRNNDKMKSVLDGTIDKIEIDGRVYEFQIEPLMELGYVQGMMIWMLDATEHYANLKRISENANRDGLTGLYNRSHFKELVDKDVHDNRSGCFVMMDMDNFKQVNDAYGHQRGDSVLKSLANILAEYSPEDFYSCRIGGDEFCGYFRKMTDVELIKQQLDEIIAKFAQSFRENDEAKCSISMGVYINTPLEGKLLDCSGMYSAADVKLYEAKAAGKNTYRI